MKGRNMNKKKNKQKVTTMKTRKKENDTTNRNPF